MAKSCGCVNFRGLCTAEYSGSAFSATANAARAKQTGDFVIPRFRTLAIDIPPWTFQTRRQFKKHS
jgi:hypothetical protein